MMGTDNPERLEPQCLTCCRSLVEVKHPSHLPQTPPESCAAQEPFDFQLCNPDETCEVWEEGTKAPGDPPLSAW